MEKNLNLILQELQHLNERVGKIEDGQTQMNQKAISIETELKEFRLETRTALQLIQTGQQGTCEEMTQRFKEVKHSLDNLEKDIELTYQKTALHELQLNRTTNKTID